MMRHSPVLSTHPLRALQDLERAAKKGVSWVVFPPDLRIDPNLRDEKGEHFDPRDHEGIDARVHELIEERRGETRLIGPLGALQTGPGNIAVISNLGKGGEAFFQSLGDGLSLGIDLGLGQMVSVAEILEDLGKDEAIERIGLLLTPGGLPLPPESEPRGIYHDFQKGLHSVFESGKTVMALTTPKLLPLYEAQGILAFDHQKALATALQGSLEGLTFVSDLAYSHVLDALIESLHLPLAEVQETTLLSLEQELPRSTRIGPHLGIPHMTERHMEVAKHLLGRDPKVKTVIVVRESDDAFSLLQGLASLKQEKPKPRISVPGMSERKMALMMGLRLMKRLSLGREQVLSLLGPEVPAVEAHFATSLLRALGAAEALGYPLRISGSPKLFHSKEELEEGFQSLMEGLSMDDSPRYLLAGEPFETALYQAYPLPRLSLKKELIGLPLKKEDEGRYGALLPLLKALSVLALHHRELRFLRLDLGQDGKIIDASGQLLPLPDATF